MRGGLDGLVDNPKEKERGAQHPTHIHGDSGDSGDSSDSKSASAAYGNRGHISFRPDVCAEPIAGYRWSDKGVDFEVRRQDSGLASHLVERSPDLIPDVLRCLLQVDPETRRWNGHCLDLDLATSGKDAEEAWKNLRAVVRLHVEHCFTNWQQGLKFRANDDEIAVFEALKTKQ